MLYQIAVYLQMTGLELFCIVRFTRHLNRTNAGTYLKAFRKSRNIVDGLANAALRFEQSGRPSHSGVYFLERRGDRTVLSMVSEESSSVHRITTQLQGDDTESFSTKLHHFDNLLLFFTASHSFARKRYLHVYGLLTGKTHTYDLKQNILCCRHPVVCSGGNKLFVIVMCTEKPGALLISVFHRKNILEKFKRIARKNVYFEKLSRKSRRVILFFSFCVADKIYVFCCDEIWFTLDRVFFIEICSETFSVLRVQYLTFKQTERYQLFQPFFYDKTQQKLFVMLDGKHAPVVVLDFSNKILNINNLLLLKTGFYSIDFSRISDLSFAMHENLHYIVKTYKSRLIKGDNFFSALSFKIMCFKFENDQFAYKREKQMLNKTRNWRFQLPIGLFSMCVILSDNF